MLQCIGRKGWSMMLRALLLRLREGRCLILLRIVLLALCAAPLPLATPAAPVEAQASHGAAPDNSIPLGQAEITPSVELSPTVTPSEAPSPTAASPMTPTSTLEPTNSTQIVASAEPTDAAMPG